MKATNNTGQPREVQFIDGSGEVLLPREALIFNEGDIYSFELDRISKFLTIEKNSKRKQSFNQDNGGDS